MFSNKVVLVPELDMGQLGLEPAGGPTILWAMNGIGSADSPIGTAPTYAPIFACEL